MQESIVIEAVKDGDTDAFRVLVDRYNAGLVRYVYGIVLDIDLAQDVAQDAFVTAFQKLHRYNSSYAFSTWLYAIAKHHALRQLAKSNKFVELLEESVDETIAPADALDKDHEAKKVNAAMHKLKPEYRSVVQLYYWDDKSYEEIAQLLDKPINTVRTWLRRAKEELRSELA